MRADDLVVARCYQREKHFSLQSSLCKSIIKLCATSFTFLGTISAIRHLLWWQLAEFMEPGERMRKEKKEEDSDYLCTCDLLAERLRQRHTNAVDWSYWIFQQHNSLHNFAVAPEHEHLKSNLQNTKIRHTQLCFHSYTSTRKHVIFTLIPQRNQIIKSYQETE